MWGSVGGGEEKVSGQVSVKEGCEEVGGECGKTCQVSVGRGVG